jgi:hypothetical protein
MGLRRAAVGLCQCRCRRASGINERSVLNVVITRLPLHLSRQITNRPARPVALPVSPAGRKPACLPIRERRNSRLRV